MRTCRVCGLAEGPDRPFRPKGNICQADWRIYKSEYDRRNRERLSNQVRAWKAENRARYRETTRQRYHALKKEPNYVPYCNRTMKSWLGRLASQAHLRARKPGAHDNKAGHEFDLDVEFLLDLYERQEGRCALTGIELAHERHNPLSASIDRIDSAFGYTRSNVQIVATFANHAKRSLSNKDFQAIISRIRSST